VEDAIVLHLSRGPLWCLAKPAIHLLIVAEESKVWYQSKKAFSTKNLAESRFKAVRLSTPEALEHLHLAIPALHLTSSGVGVVHAEQRSFVDPHWDRRLSYLNIGWR